MLKDCVDFWSHRDAQAPVQLLKFRDVVPEVWVQVLTKTGHDHLVKLDQGPNHISRPLSYLGRGKVFSIAQKFVGHLEKFPRLVPLESPGLVGTSCDIVFLHEGVDELLSLLLVRKDSTGLITVPVIRLSSGMLSNSRAVLPGSPWTNTVFEILGLNHVLCSRLGKGDKRRDSAVITGLSTPACPLVDTTWYSELTFRVLDITFDRVVVEF